MSKVEAIMHIVIATKQRECTIVDEYRRDLYAVMYSFLTDQGCTVHRIGGIENHVHLLVSLNPVLALSALVKELKRLTSVWLKSNAHFPLFHGWQPEYAAFSCSPADKDRVAEYIKNQQIHHKNKEIEEYVVWWNRNTN